MSRYNLKISEETIGTICKEIQEGTPVEDSCIVAGVSRQCYYNWRDRGEQLKKEIEAEPRRLKKVEKLYIRFADDLEKALAESKRRLVKTIKSHSYETWQAAAWLLERRFPDEFGRKIATEVSGPGGGPIQHEAPAMDLSKLNDEELMALMPILEKLNECHSDDQDQSN